MLGLKITSFFLFLVQKWWRILVHLAEKIMGTLNFWVQVPYLSGNVCQQKEFTPVCFSFISSLHARDLLTMYKKNR